MRAEDSLLQLPIDWSPSRTNLNMSKSWTLTQQPHPVHLTFQRNPASSQAVWGACLQPKNIVSIERPKKRQTATTHRAQVCSQRPKNGLRRVPWRSKTLRGTETKQSRRIQVVFHVVDSWSETLEVERNFQTWTTIFELSAFAEIHSLRIVYYLH